MAKYGELVSSFGERAPTIRKLETVEEVLKEADVRPRQCPSCILLSSAQCAACAQLLVLYAAHRHVHAAWHLRVIASVHAAWHPCVFASVQHRGHPARLHVLTPGCQ